jgi:hypothetical protein
MKKRGQVTLFIIIGIIIVLVAIMGIAFRHQIARTIGRLFFPEAEPLRVFVERCIDINAEGAVELAAQQGGYVVVPERLAQSFDGYLPPPPSPLKVPMWWYKGTSYVPSVEEVELQLAEYVQDNLEICLNDFDAFAQYDVIEQGNLTVEADVHEEDVRFLIKYPLLVKPKEANNTIQLNEFYRIVEKPIGKLHELAAKIMEIENEEGIIENITMDIIAIADGAGDSAYFPYEGFDIRCGRGKVWSEQFQLIPDLQNLLHYNLNYIVFRGTNYVDSGYDYFNKQYAFRVSEKNHPDVRVNILYNENWGMELDVQPSKGDIVEGYPMKIPLLGACVKIYHHRYDIEYPIMFQLTDLEHNLVFNFATPIIIEKNLPKRYVSSFVQRFEYSVSDEEYCADRVQERTLIVRDAVSGDAIENVSLTYECVSFSCNLGKTEIPTFDGIPIYGSTPSLTTRLPVCLNGFLTASKEGYRENVMQYTSGPGAGSPPAIELIPLKSLKLLTRVVEITPDNKVSVRGLEDDESVAIFLINEEEGFDETFFYPTNRFYKSFDVIYKDLDYDLDAKLIKNDNVVGGLFLQNWTVTRNTLSAANEIVVNVISSSEPPETLDEFAQYFKDVIEPKSSEYVPVIR